jgi:DNA-binding CsgD family transcriptional regulator
MKNSLNRLLSKQDLVSLVDLISTSLNCTCESDLTGLLQRLKGLVPLDYAFCGLAKISSSNGVDSFKSINISYPEEWLDLYIARKYNLCDPVFATNFIKPGLQLWSETYESNPPPHKFLSDAHDFGLIQGYTFGMKSRTGNASSSNSLFSFSGKSLENHKRSNLILETVMPHVHEALVRVTSTQQEKENVTAASQISAREKEVLHLLKDGKNSWAVSTILNISERTVNYHVGNIMEKLGAESRLHAVAIAAKLNLIDLS